MIYLLIDIIIGVVFLAMTLLALVDKGYSKPQNRIFSGVCLAVFAWIIADRISTSLDTPAHIAVLANYVLFASTIAMVILLSKLLLCLVELPRLTKWFGRIEPALWAVAVISATPLVGQGVEVQDKVYGVVFGPGVALYGVALLFCAFVCVYVALKGWRNEDKDRQRQIRIIGVSFVVATILTLLLGFIIPLVTNDFAIAQIAIAPFALLVTGLFITTIRHGLFDVKDALLRGFSYVFVLASLALLYWAVSALISLFIDVDRSGAMGVHPTDVGLALLLAFLFQPLKHFYEKITRKILYRRRYDVEDFYEHFNMTIRSAISLRQLMSRTTKVLEETFRPERMALYVYKNGTSLVSAGVSKAEKTPLADVRMFDELRRPIHVDDIELSEPLRRVMVSHRISVAVPLYRNDETVGLLCLGERRSSHFSHRDLRVLRVVAGELVIGIQNTLVVQEIRDLNDGLKQRIDGATKELRRSNKELMRLDETKDEFMSMASHQLRTPLTSIKGYISMLIDGDLGKVSDSQKRVLEEAFSSSERMVHLIGDFLNVSRLQTGKFMIEPRPTDLAEIVSREVAALEQNATSRGLVIEYVAPKNIPELTIDADKFRQVIMNLIDNAIYYSKSGTKIKVILKKAGESVEFKVKDSGIGVPIDEQAGLFSKFFRATNARRSRPDGTGVGLFLAKEVVMAHGGNVIFEARAGKGSTFGFRIPVDKVQ